MRLAQRVLDVLADPNIAYLLMMAGLLGLYVEFTHPGLVLPGRRGRRSACCSRLAALQVLPVNYGGLALLVLGVALLVAEAFLPSFGVVGVGGLVAFVLGSLLLFDTPERRRCAVDRGLIAGAAGDARRRSSLGRRLRWSCARSGGRPSGRREGMLGEIGRCARDRLGRRAARCSCTASTGRATPTSADRAGRRGRGHRPSTACALRVRRRARAG